MHQNSDDCRKTVRLLRWTAILLALIPVLLMLIGIVTIALSVA